MSAKCLNLSGSIRTPLNQGENDLHKSYVVGELDIFLSHSRLETHASLNVAMRGMVHALAQRALQLPYARLACLLVDEVPDSVVLLQCSAGNPFCLLATSV